MSKSISDVIDVLKEILGPTAMEISVDTKFTDIPGWDSFKLVEIILEIESKFDIVMSPSDIENIQTVRDFEVFILN